MKRSLLILTGVFLVIGMNVSAEMYLDNNGNVGIGTTTPIGKFDVNGDICLGSVCRSTWPTGSGTGAFTDTGTVAYYNGGKVGIGTSSPGHELSVNGLIESKVGGFMFPDGTIQTTATIGSDTWDNHSLDAADGSPIDAVYVDNDGIVGIGTSNPLTKLDIYSPVAITDWWPWDAYMLRIESGSVNNPLNTIQIIKSYGIGESELRFDNGDVILGAVYTLSNNYSLNFLVGSVGWNHVTFEDPYDIGDLEVHLRAGSNNEAALAFNNSPNVNVAGYVSKIYRPANSDDLVVNFDGIGDVMTFNSSTGNIGIGTTNPQSSLQVAGYVQLPLTSGSPPSTDCDEVSERGRMIVDDVSDLLYICVASGWSAK